MINWNPKQYDDLAMIQKQTAKLIVEYAGNFYTNVLDIGCGTGYILDEIISTGQEVNYCGIDSSTEMIDFATNKFAKNVNYACQFICCNANSQLTIDKIKTSDLITINFALHWIENRTDWIELVKKNMKPLAKLIIAVPLQSSFKEINTKLGQQAFATDFLPNIEIEALASGGKWFIKSITQQHKSLLDFIKFLKILGSYCDRNQIGTKKLYLWLRQYGTAMIDACYQVCFIIIQKP